MSRRCISSILKTISTLNNDFFFIDSGGPLQIVNPDNKCIYSIIGITSFGAGCGAKNSPSVYTRVSSYIDWIESKVWAS